MLAFWSKTRKYKASLERHKLCYTKEEEELEKHVPRYCDKGWALCY